VGTLRDWQSAGKTWSFEGYSIFYREDGAGEALVLIHGFPTASWDWSHMWDALAVRYRLVAADMLGFGFSAKPRGHDYSLAEQASLQEGLLASLGVRRAHLLVHDYGNSVAQELLARFEERRAGGAAGLEIRSICFLNGGLFPEVHRATRAQKLLLSPVGPLLARLMNERSFARGFAAIFGPQTRPGPDAMHDFWSLMAHGDGRRVAHRIIHYLPERKRSRDRWVGAMQRTRVPLRFVNGPEDPVSGRHMAERYRELIPDPDVVLLEDIGHYPQVEDPQGTLRAFFEFVDRVEAQGG
jgi:pimeloyl-ACP methyl ester carboxylesterase